MNIEYYAVLIFSAAQPNLTACVCNIFYAFSLPAHEIRDGLVWLTRKKSVVMASMASLLTMYRERRKKVKYYFQSGVKKARA